MICNLNVKVSQRQGKSYLKDAFVTQPFRIVPVGQYRRDNAEYLMMMSSSPGILDGDDHRIQIEVEEGGKLQLQTQAYQRLYHMQDSSRQHLKVILSNNSSFSFVPHPIVPQTSATYFSKNEIHLSEGCFFILGEIITCGRKLSGEEFKYNHFQNLIEVYHGDRLILKDNVLLKPEHMPLHDLGLMEGFSHQGTFLCANTQGVDMKDVLERFYEEFHETEDVEFGISSSEHSGFMVRVLGTGGEQLFNMFKKMESILWDLFVIKN